MKHWKAYLPTSGDLKSGDSLFCTTPPPPPQPRMLTAPTPHPHAHPPHQQIALGHYITSYMNYMESKWTFIIVMTNWSLSLTKHVQKCPKTVQWIKKVQILWKNRLNFKLKRRNAQKSILSGRLGALTGRLWDLMTNLETPGKTGRVGRYGKESWK